VVEVGVSQHDGVEVLGSCPKRLGDLEIRHLAFGAGLVAAVDEHPSFGGVQDERGTADLTTAPERRDSNPLLAAHLLAVDLATHALEDVPALLTLLFEEVPDVRDGRGFDWRRADDLRSPADLLGNLSQRRPVAADDYPGFLRLDDDFASVLVEVEFGDTRFVRNDVEHLLACGVGAGKHLGVRADRDALSQLRREVPNEVAVAGELLRVAGVDHQLRPFIFHVGDRDRTGDLLLDLTFQLLELRIYLAHVSESRAGTGDSLSNCRRCDGANVRICN